jgi:acyl-CoA thioesterase
VSRPDPAATLFANDQASQSLGLELVSASPGAAEVRMTVRADMANGHGTCHGGYIFLLADSAFAFACNSHGPPTVAAGASIDFIRPARVGDLLIATAREVSRGKQTGLYDIVVSRADRAIIAAFRGRSHELAAVRPPTNENPS